MCATSRGTTTLGGNLAPDRALGAGKRQMDACAGAGGARSERARGAGPLLARAGSPSAAKRGPVAAHASRSTALTKQLTAWAMTTLAAAAIWALSRAAGDVAFSVAARSATFDPAALGGLGAAVGVAPTAAGEWSAASARMLLAAAYASTWPLVGKKPLPNVRWETSLKEALRLLARGLLVVAPMDALCVAWAKATPGALRGETAPPPFLGALWDTAGTPSPFARVALVGHAVWLVLALFCLEATFDFAHYWTHRAMHSSKALYRLAGHAHHHRHVHPTTLHTLEQAPLDYVLVSVIPCMFAYCVFKALPGALRLSASELELAMVYKLITEFAGHSGMDCTWTSFPACMWLPRALGIELHVYDHDAHHARGMCNYSKRLILWDVVFGTRYQRRSQNRQ